MEPREDGAMVAQVNSTMPKGRKLKSIYFLEPFTPPNLIEQQSVPMSWHNWILLIDT